MKLTKSIAMIPLIISIGGKSFPYQNTSFVYNEDDIKNNLININDNIIKESKRDESFIFESHYVKLRLDEYIKKWRRETLILSDVSKIISNDSFNKIVQLGKTSVPFILEQLKREPSNLVWALNQILGFKVSSGPISIEDASLAWIKWGKNKDLVS